MLRFLFMHKLCISILFSPILLLWFLLIFDFFIICVYEPSDVKTSFQTWGRRPWRQHVTDRNEAAQVWEGTDKLFFQFSCFKNCLERNIYTSLRPQLRLYVRLFWRTWRERSGQCCYLSVTGWQRAKVFSWRQPGRSAKTINLLVFA